MPKHNFYENIDSGNKDNPVSTFDDSGWEEPQRTNDDEDYEGEI